MRAAAPHLRETTLLTDLASVKAPVAELARRHLPHPEICVGAHPMTGGHAVGFAAADPGLVRGRALHPGPLRRRGRLCGGPD